MKVGYVRISTKEQNTARQDVLMEELDVERVYTDKLSGKNTDRPELHKMMDFVREGDVVIVESFSRFARNTRDLLDLRFQRGFLYPHHRRYHVGGRQMPEKSQEKMQEKADKNQQQKNHNESFDTEHAI